MGRLYRGLPALARAPKLAPVKRLVLATQNPGKLREFRRLLAGLPLEVVAPADVGLTLDVPEEGDSYTAHSEAKAAAYAAAGRCLALADDSGIEVDALAGRPGVHSARYGGPGLDDAGRTALLLYELEGVPAERRTARYRAVVTIAGCGPARSFEATMEGRIATAQRGSGGFGYDPVFEIADGRTSAELSEEEKDALSHRGKAVRLAAAYLRELLT